jgi:hypothetical protein
MMRVLMNAFPAKTPEGLADGAPSAELKVTPRTAAAELGLMVLVVEMIEWVVPLTGNNPTAYGVFAAAIAVLMAVCFVRDGLGPKQLGIRLDNFIPTLVDLLPFVVIFIIAVVSIGLAAGSIRLGDRFWSMLAVVPPWALLQQYMLLAFAGPRLRILLGRGEAATIATAGLFAILHLPNPALTIVCAAGGFIWASEYARRPNLLANTVTHTVASAFLANSLPRSLLRNMVVGYNHFLR